MRVSVLQMRLVRRKKLLLYLGYWKF